METYVTGINYYNPGDLLLEWVRGVQNGADVSGIDLNQALDQAAMQCQYAQAVRKAFLFTHAASEYFMGRMEKETLYDTLGLGPNERD